jgi:hypothetical protein
MATAKDTKVDESKADSKDYGSTNAPRGVNELPAVAIADEPGGAALQKAVQEATDGATRKGYVGQKADRTPRENYTLKGVTSGAPTPENTVRTADPLI